MLPSTFEKPRLLSGSRRNRLGQVILVGIGTAALILQIDFIIDAVGGGVDPSVGSSVGFSSHLFWLHMGGLGLIIFSIIGLLLLIRRWERVQAVMDRIATAISAETGQQFFRTLTECLHDVLNVDLVFVAELTGEGRARTVAICEEGVIGQNRDYDLRQTACEDVAAGRPVRYAREILKQYPQDRMLAEMNAVSFIGAPLVDSSGVTRGLVVAVGKSALVDTEVAKAAFQIVAIRASNELERRASRQALQQANDELEDQVARRTAELEQVNKNLRNELAERREIEEALRQSEARWLSITENSPDYVLLLDLDGTVRYVNHTVVRPKDEIIGTTAYSVVPPESQQVMKDCFHQVQQTGQPGQFEVDYHHPETGALMRFEGRVAPVVRSGKVVNLILCATDITERRRTQEALRESVERYRLLFDNANDSAFVFHLSDDGQPGNFIEVNNMACRSLGYTRDELSKMSPMDLSGSDNKRLISQRLEKLRQTGIIVVDGIHVSKTGRRIPVEISSHLFELEGRPTVLSLARDTTEREKAQEALRESEERFRQIADQIGDVLWMTSVDRDHLFYISPSFAGLWGVPCDELYRNPMMLLDHIHPDDRQRIADFVATRPTSEFSLEYRIVRPDETVRWVWDRGFPIRNAAGEVYRIAGTFTDVTEQVQTRQREAEQQSKLMHADRLTTVGRLAAGIAHEINNPLAVLYGMLQEMDLDIKSVSAAEIKKMLGVSRRIKTVVNNLLVFSRQTGANKRIGELNRVIEDSLSFLSSQLRRNGIELDLQLAGDLPPLNMNPDQLQQVVVNIVLNAVDAMPDGGRLVVASSHVNRHIQVTFEDTGIGIAPEQIDKIFLPFFTTKEVGKGTGLGLSISYGIVKDHGGDIQVTSQVGRGSTFSLTLPLD